MRLVRSLWPLYNRGAISKKRGSYAIYDCRAVLVFVYVVIDIILTIQIAVAAKRWGGSVAASSSLGCSSLSFQLACLWFAGSQAGCPVR